MSSSNITALTLATADSAPKQCNYSYPFQTVHEFIDFSQKVRPFFYYGPYVLF